MVQRHILVHAPTLPKLRCRPVLNDGIADSAVSQFTTMRLGSELLCVSQTRCTWVDTALRALREQPIRSQIPNHTVPPSSPAFGRLFGVGQFAVPAVVAALLDQPPRFGEVGLRGQVGADQLLVVAGEDVRPA